MKRYFVIAVIAFICAGCSQTQRTLYKAGENKKELKLVLDNFSHDREKFKAAKYIISNMEYHMSYDSLINIYQDAADSILNFIRDPKNMAYNSELVLNNISIIDSFNEIFGKYRHLSRDIQNVKSDYLISDIELSFDLWKNSPWCSHLNFEEFCEYILPYKCCARQPVSNWKKEWKDYLGECLNLLNISCKENTGNPYSAVDSIVMSLKWKYPTGASYAGKLTLFRPSSILNSPIGNCNLSCTAMMQIMRSKGIPVSIDYIPQWGHMASGHSWMSVLNLRHVINPFDPYELFESLVLPENRAIPKIFRETYSPNKEIVKRLRRGWYIPYPLNAIFFKDVTDEYMKPVDVTVKANPGRGNVYVAVFNNTEWIPVACGQRLINGRIRFKKLGSGCLYLPVSYSRNGEMKVEGMPFFIDNHAEIKYFKGGDGNLTNISTNRKYPRYRHVWSAARRMHGGSLTDDKKNLIASLDAEYPIMRGNISFDEPIHVDRLWLNPTENKRADFAELIFYDCNGEQIPFKPKYNGKRLSPYQEDNYNAVSDGDALTFFAVKPENPPLELDFGKGVYIKELIYFRRSDGNNIYPGHEYTLNIWKKNGWTPVKRITADRSEYLEFENIPSGELYLLVCNTTGTQSRPFTIYKGETTWY